MMEEAYTSTDALDSKIEFDFAINDRTSNFVIISVITICLIAIFMGLKSDIYGCNLFTTYFMLGALSSCCCAIWIVFPMGETISLVTFSTVAWTISCLKLSTNKHYVNFWINGRSCMPAIVKAKKYRIAISDKYIYDMQPFLNKQYLFDKKWTANSYTKSHDIQLPNNTNIFWKFNSKYGMTLCLNIRFFLLLAAFCCYMTFLYTFTSDRAVFFWIGNVIIAEFCIFNKFGLACFSTLFGFMLMYSFFGRNIWFEDYNNDLFGSESSDYLSSESIEYELFFMLWYVSYITVATFCSLYFAQKESFNIGARYFLSFLSSTLDLATDLLVAYFWYISENYSWAAMQIGILFLSQIFTIYLLIIHNINSNSNNYSNSDRNTKIKVKIIDFLMILFGFGKLWYGIKELSSLAKEKSRYSIRNVVKTNMNFTMEFVKLCEILFETLPSLMLGSYIIFLQNSISISVALSMVVSFANLSFSLIQIMMNAQTFDITDTDDIGTMMNDDRNHHGIRTYTSTMAELDHHRDHTYITRIVSNNSVPTPSVELTLNLATTSVTSITDVPTPTSPTNVTNATNATISMVSGLPNAKKTTIVGIASSDSLFSNRDDKLKKPDIVIVDADSDNDHNNINMPIDKPKLSLQIPSSSIVSTSQIDFSQFRQETNISVNSNVDDNHSLQDEFAKCQNRKGLCCCWFCCPCCCRASQCVTLVAIINLTLYSLDLLIYLVFAWYCRYSFLYSIGYLWRIASILCSFYGFPCVWSYNIFAASAFNFYWKVAFVYNILEIILFALIDRVGCADSVTQYPQILMSIAKILFGIQFYQISAKYKQIVCFNTLLLSYGFICTAN